MKSVFNTTYKKFELLLTRCAKAYSSFCLQTVSLSPAVLPQFIVGVYTAAKDRKINKNPVFWKFRVFLSCQCWYDQKACPIACCDRQHAHAYLQPFWWNTGQQW